MNFPRDVFSSGAARDRCRRFATIYDLSYIYSRLLNPCSAFPPCFHCSILRLALKGAITKTWTTRMGQAWPLEATAPRVITMLSLNRRKRTLAVEARGRTCTLSRTSAGLGSSRENGHASSHFFLSPISSSIVLSRVFLIFFSLLRERERGCSIKFGIKISLFLQDYNIFGNLESWIFLFST